MSEIEILLLTDKIDTKQKKNYHCMVVMGTMRCSHTNSHDLPLQYLNSKKKSVLYNIEAMQPQIYYN